MAANLNEECFNHGKSDMCWRDLPARIDALTTELAKLKLSGRMVMDDLIKERDAALKRLNIMTDLRDGAGENYRQARAEADVLRAHLLAVRRDSVAHFRDCDECQRDYNEYWTARLSAPAPASKKPSIRPAAESAEAWFVKRPIPVRAEQARGGEVIVTLEGNSHPAKPGDWIITGVRGERYVCDREIFELTYEAAPRPMGGV